MTKRMLSLLTVAAVAVATPALAHEMGGKSHEHRTGAQMQSEKAHGHAHHGTRATGRTHAHHVDFTLSPWYLRGAGQFASANATVYTDANEAITGVRLESWGLPDPERINNTYNSYVVWLHDTETNEMKNIGVLDSRNGGKAVFGYTPEEPLMGYDSIVVTPEPTFATTWPMGWQQMTAMIMGGEAGQGGGQVPSMKENHEMEHEHR